MFSKNKTEFDWLAGDSAPLEYPMRILHGTLYYHDAKGGLYIPTMAVLNPGWNNSASTHVVGKPFKPLPDRLDIDFFSFTENQLYKGSFDLPYETILAWFKAGVASNRTARDKDRPTFGRITVGVAPGGAVAVWVTGQETREVFFGKAQPYDDVILDTLGNEIKDRKEYVEQTFRDDMKPEIVEQIRTEGVPIGRWEKYRTRYQWELTFAGPGTAKRISVVFFNGEEFALEANEASASRPLPKIVTFRSQQPNEASPVGFDFVFDQKEFYAAFDRLSVAGERIQLELTPLMPRERSTARIYNSKESIPLPRTVIRW